MQVRLGGQIFNLAQVDAGMLSRQSNLEPVFLFVIMSHDGKRGKMARVSEELCRAATYSRSEEEIMEFYIDDKTRKTRFTRECIVLQ